MAQAAAQAQISASEPNLDAALASVTTSVINSSPSVPPAPAPQVQQQMPPSVPSVAQPPPQPQPAPVQQHASNQRTTAVVMNQSQLHQQHQRQNNVHIPVVPNERTEPVIPYSRIISNQNFNSNVQTDKQHNQKQKDERNVFILYEG